MNDGPLIALEAVRVVRYGKTILDVDKLNINAGQMLGVIGTNGAGKTTLLRTCIGMVKPTNGSVILLGRNLSLMTSWQKTNLRKKIGYVPQSAEYNSSLPLTVCEVVAMGRTSVKSLFASSSPEDDDIVDTWLERLQLDSISNQTFRTLSGGQQQRTLIARAMVQQPDVLILDEPGANLDLKVRNQLIQIIDDLYAQLKLTVMIVSHELALLPRNCQTIIVMDEGRVVFNGSCDEVLDPEKLEKVYKCPVEVLNIDGKKFIVGKT